MSLIFFFIIISVLILIHELGHFIFAKINGVKIEEFGFGLPPRLFGIKKGETIYSINLFPFGGFVKLFGEEYHEIDNKKTPLKDKNKAFINKKPWQKTLIITAGVIMNFFLAVSIFYYLLINNQFKSNIIPLFFNHQFKFGSKEKKIVVINVNKNSPAEKQNIVFEDILLRYKDNNNNQWRNIYDASQFINIVNKNFDKEIILELQNNKNGEVKIVKVKPVYNKNLKRYIIGISLTNSVIINYEKPLEKILSGFLHSYNLLDYNLKVIGNLFSQAVREKKPESITQTLSGPIGIFAIISDTVKSSGKKLVDNLLNLTGLLSLSLALMNILPFPALDGGRLIFVIYEWVTGKKNHQNLEKHLNLIGFLILISLAIIISINDILNFF